MAYIDGLVIAVPKANQQKFIDRANTADALFIEMGATRTLECWGDDVPAGKTSDFHMAVKATDDEDVVFSWIEIPGNDYSMNALGLQGAAFALVGGR